jgi:lipid-A-disaccharide synthase-like uncharacterized protein
MSMEGIDTWLLGFGFLGQAVFASRFIVQWIVSERRGESVIPLAFWYLSLGGAALLFTYATLRKDPVFMVGQAGGAFVYVRNLVLIRRSRARRAPGPRVEREDGEGEGAEQDR